MVQEEANPKPEEGEAAAKSQASKQAEVIRALAAGPRLSDKQLQAIARAREAQKRRMRHLYWKLLPFAIHATLTRELPPRLTYFV